MRVMVMVRATPTSEAGTPPSQRILTEMINFNEELVKAGIMLEGNGLVPSSKGARIRFSGSKRSVVDGPFTETKELIAGFWIWQVRSFEEAIEWARRSPKPFDEDCEIEVRQMYELDDLGPGLTPELREKEERLRAESEKLAGKK